MKQKQPYQQRLYRSPTKRIDASGWLDRHLSAVTCPKAGHERALVQMLAVKQPTQAGADVRPLGPEDPIATEAALVGALVGVGVAEPAGQHLHERPFVAGSGTGDGA